MTTPCPDCVKHYEKRCRFHSALDAARERLKEVCDKKREQ